MGNLFSRGSSLDDLSHVVSVDPYNFLSEDETETRPLRNAEFPQELVNSLVDGEQINTAYDVFQRGCRISRTRPFLGQRRRQGDDSEELFDRYQWWSYGEVESMSRALGTGLLKLGLIEPTLTPEELYEPAREMSLLGIGSRNRVEWFVTEQAANAYSITLVPLYETLGDWAVYYMVSDTKLTCLCGGTPNLLQYVKIISEFRATAAAGGAAAGGDAAGSGGTGASGSAPGAKGQTTQLPTLERDRVKSFVCFDPITAELEAGAEKLGIKLYSWVDILEMGQKEAAYAPLKLPTRESVASICYSSGTTGVPKGVVVTHGSVAANICAVLRGPLSISSLTIDHQDCYMSYLPLAHVFERLCIHIMMSIGGRLAIYSGDPRKLLLDIRLAKPTIFASVPRLYMRINDTINAGIVDHSAVARYLFAQGMETKIEGLRRSGTTSHPIWDLLVFNKVKDLMGGKLRYMLVGGAALDKNIQERMAALFCCPLLEGYGLTETLGTTFLRRADDSIYGHIGAPLPCNEIKLISVPEMNYLVTNDPPTGELCIRGHTITPSYFKNLTQYQDNLTADGWFRTGDIAALLPHGKRIKIVDRRKNIFKLSQGEYIAPERLESQLSQAPLIGQVYIYGDSARSSLVAIICLDEDDLLRRKHALKNAHKIFTQKTPEGKTQEGKTDEKSHEKAHKAHKTPDSGASPTSGDQSAAASGDTTARAAAGAHSPAADSAAAESSAAAPSGGSPTAGAAPASPVNWEGACEDEELRRLVKEQIHEIELSFGVKGFEKIKAFTFAPEPFTCDNGLLTPTFKLKRSVAAQTFRTSIEEMYRSIGEWYDRSYIPGEGDEKGNDKTNNKATDYAPKSTPPHFVEKDSKKTSAPTTKQPPKSTF